MRNVLWLAILSACTPALSLPQAAQVDCTDNGDCPDGWLCSAELGRCVESSDDRTPAAVTDVIITPPRVRAGVTVSVDFSVSKDLGQLPTVQMGEGSAATATVTQTGARSYHAEYTSTGSEPEGAAALQSTLVDSAGNLANVALGELTFDFTAPTLDAINLTSAAFAKLGSSVSVEVQANEVLGVPPAVESAKAWTLSSTTGATYTFAYVVDSSDAEGPLSAVVTLTDLAGNIANLAPQTVATLDFTAPSVTGADVATSHVRAGQNAVVSFSLGEELGADPVVVLRQGPTSLTMARAGRTGNQWTYTYRFLSSDPEGDYQAEVDEAIDLAGNVLSQEQIGTLNFDNSEPSITNLTVSPERASANAGFDVVTIAFDIDEPPSELIVAVGAAGAAACDTPTPSGPWLHYTCTHTVSQASDNEGVAVIAVTAVDDAGNLAFAASNVTFDFTAPSIVYATAAPSLAPLGATTVLSLAASEPLSTEPALTSGVGLSYVGGTQYIYTHTVTGADVDGDFPVTAVLTDLAGNSSASLSVATISLDAHVPVISSLVLSSGSLFSQVSGHNQVAVDFLASENLDAPASLSVRVGGADATCGTYDGAGYQCTYDVSAADTEGVAVVSIVGRDAAGNSAAASTTVQFDFTPPSFSVSPQLSRDDNFAPASVSGDELYLNRARVDAPATMPRVFVSFSLSEPLATDPELTPAASQVSHAGLSYTLTYVQPASGADGDVALEVTLEDLAGNTVSLPAGTLHIDNTPPALSAAQFTHRRFPWGGPLSTTPSQVLDVSGSVEAHGILSVLSGADPTFSQELARVSADAAGALASIALPPIDRSAVYLRLRDRAGNPSSALGQRVDRGEWTATFGNHATGSNPHVMRSTSAAENVTLGTVGFEQEVFDYAPHAIMDGASDTMAGVVQDSWIPSLAVTAPAQRDGAALAFDPERGETMLFGGVDYLPGFPPFSFGAITMFSDTWFFDGNTWTERTSSGPSARAFAGMAYLDAQDPAYSAMVIWGGGAYSIPYPASNNPQLTFDLWYRTNGAYVKHVDLGGSGPSPRIAPLLLADPARHRLLMIGGNCQRFAGSLAPCGDAWELVMKSNPSGNDRYQWNNLIPYPSDFTTAPPPLNIGLLAATIDTARDVLVILAPDSPNATYEADLSAASLSFTSVCDNSCVNNIYQTRIDGLLVFDPLRGQSILVSGLRQSGPPFYTMAQEHQELWSWGGASLGWQMLACFGSPDGNCVSPLPPAQSFSGSSNDIAGHSSATYDPRRGQIVYFTREMYSGFSTWPGTNTLKHARKQPPAFTASFDIGEVGVAPSAIARVSLDAAATGNGYDTSATPQTGATLWVFDAVSQDWQSLDQGEGTLSYATASAGEAQSYVDADRLLYARVSSSYPGNGDYSQLANVSLDALWLTVQYTLP